MELGVEDWEQEKALMAAEEEERAEKQRQDDTNMFPPFRPPKDGDKDKSGEGQEDVEDDAA
jgi:hypothetical protein